MKSLHEQDVQKYLEGAVESALEGPDIKQLMKALNDLLN